MPGYEDAIEKLKNKMEEEVKQKQKVKENGTIKSDTKWYNSPYEVCKIFTWIKP